MARVSALTGRAPELGASTAPQPMADAGKATPVGRFTRVDAAEVWRSDEGFADWLAKNVDALDEASGLTLSAAKLFSGDPPVVIAEHDSHPVVIVCQRGPATDAAFGSLLRHVAASSSHNAIWVCGEAIAEHGASISWLNRSIDGRFLMVRVSAARIGDSSAAAMFEQVIRAPRNTDADAPVDDTTARRAAAGLARRAEDWVVEPPTAV